LAIDALTGGPKEDAGSEDVCVEELLGLEEMEAVVELVGAEVTGEEENVEEDAGSEKE
jgi:hypothetical protein